MRPIKFKAQRVSDGEWVEGSFIYPNEIMPNPSTCDEIDIGIPIIIDPNTICQFTGLTDKNGKEIYEGDKIKVSTAFIDIFGQIIWSDGDLCYMISWFNGDSEPLYGWHNKELELIGNIHNKNNKL